MLVTRWREYREPRQGEVMAFLSRRAEWVKSYGDNIRCRPCPSCNHNNAQNPALAVNEKTGLWRCWACGGNGSSSGKGNWYMLTKAYGEPLSESDRYKSDSYQVAPPINVSKLRSDRRRPVSNNHHPELLNYCIERGLTAPTLDDWRVSTKGANALRWPVYELSGEGKWEVVNMKVRACLDAEKASCRDWFDVKGSPTDLLLGNHLIDYDGPKRAIIFEGQWDAMTAYELGMRNVFSLPNGAENVRVGAMLRYIPADWQIWIATDMDKAGDGAAEKFFSQLGSKNVYRLRIPAPHKDLNDWYRADPFITAQDVEACRMGLEEPAADCGGFLMLNMQKKPSEMLRIVCKLPWDKLNRLLGNGLYGGQTTSLLAPSGCGKTSFVNHLSVAVASAGIAVGLISVEGTRSRLESKLQTLIREIAGENWDRIVNNLKISNLEGTKISDIELISELKRMLASGCRFIAIDNLDFICRDDNHRKSALYGLLTDIARNADAHLLVVLQPHKVDRSAIVNSGNQKGHSQILQDSDNYMSLNIINNDPVIEIEKAREEGVTIDNTVRFKFDRLTKMFYEHAPDRIKETVNGKVVYLV